jgi:bifunctional non-homologous end joining protein LigD
VPRITIPESGDAELVVEKREVRLTNLNKPFWPERGITKGLLIQYYADMARPVATHS